MTPKSAEIFLLAGTTTIATLSALVGALIVLPPARSSQMPWWERARRTYSARLAPAITVFVLLQILCPTTAFYFAIVGFRPPIPWFVGACLTPILGPMMIAMVFAWLATPRNRPIWYWLVGCISAMLFRFPNTIIYSSAAVALYLLPHDLPTVVMVLILAAAGMAFAAWGGGIWLARAIGLARPALPRAALAADWAGERVGIRAAKVYELLWPQVRVDAFIFSRYLVVTDSAATQLSDDELFALSVREITFFRQRWLAGTLRIFDSAVIFFMLACTAIGSVIGGHALLIGSATGFGTVLLVRPFYRRAQLKADALAATAVIDAASALLALARQFELNLQPIVAVSNRSPDAHLYDRLVAAGIPPPFPRPAPPSRGRIALSIAAAAGTCVILSIAFLIGMAFVVGG
jgi:hypothetical protein